MLTKTHINKVSKSTMKKMSISDMVNDIELVKCSWCGASNDTIPCSNGKVICTYCHRITEIGGK